MLRTISLSFITAMAVAGVSCQNSGHLEADGSVYSDSIISRITKVRHCITEGTPSEVASVFTYPVLRPYPLRDIVDSSAMLDYLNVMVDDSLKAIISSVAPEDWLPLGWRGYTPTDDGDVLMWDGGIYDFNYVSSKESKLREELSRKEIESLHPSLRKGWKPYYCMKSVTDGRLFRIDTAENDTAKNGEGLLRLRAYAPNSSLSDMPEMNLRGHMISEGSEGNRVLHFSAGDTILDFILDLSDDSRSQIEIVKGGEYTSSYVTPIYWRDYQPNGVFHRDVI